jgi:hypothetical protein
LRPAAVLVSKTAALVVPLTLVAVIVVGFVAGHRPAGPDVLWRSPDDRLP